MSSIHLYDILAAAQLLLIGCSGWNYGDPVEKGGWVGSFYPDSQTKRLRYYSEFFPTAELDAINSMRNSIQRWVKGHFMVWSRPHQTTTFNLV
jgi:hypothetical protein